MADVVVTVPKAFWTEWLSEGDLPGEPWNGYESHFWTYLPAAVEPGERVYIVAHGKLRGYAPLVRVESPCRPAPHRSCLVRRGGAVAVTITEPIRGFRGVRYRWWAREAELPFLDWRTP